ncbi:MAG TPA: hypothetical protein ENN41_04780 [Sediminispirochaeta sp.]|nr:hypothetical protein [Sediminispirochaeta sp.]
MKREDFIFTIGYSGDTALVDGRAKKEYSKLSLDQLIEKGLWRAAFCLALYDDSQEGMLKVVQGYNEKSGASLETVHDMKRMLGIFEVPEEISKVKVL